MNVLSLFDGISCGKLALERAGFTAFTYYASEIDKDAIQISQANHTCIIRLGDVTKVHYEKGILYSEKGDFNVGTIDLLIGGSPCQSFSSQAAYSSNLTGLAGKSGLFYEYLRILKEVQKENSNVKFLLENVKMSKQNKASLDRYLGVTGKLFDSSLVSFQKRSRFYWTNWEWELPEDRGISFQDYKETGSGLRKLNPQSKSCQRMWADGQGTNTFKGGSPNVTNREKVYCIGTKQERNPNSGLVEYEGFCRCLSVKEQELAQTLPVGYTSVVSYNKACKAIGNGWTVDAVAHIFKSLKEKPL